MLTARAPQPCACEHASAARKQTYFGHDTPNLCAGIDKKAAEMSVWKGEIRLKVCAAAAAGPLEFAEPAKVLCLAARPSAPGCRKRKQAVERAVSSLVAADYTKLRRISRSSQAHSMTCNCPSTWCTAGQSCSYGRPKKYVQKKHASLRVPPAAVHTFVLLGRHATRFCACGMPLCMLTATSRARLLHNIFLVLSASM